MYKKTVSFLTTALCITLSSFVPGGGGEPSQAETFTVHGSSIPASLQASQFLERFDWNHMLDMIALSKETLYHHEVSAVPALFSYNRTERCTLYQLAAWTPPRAPRNTRNSRSPSPSSDLYCLKVMAMRKWTER